MTVPARANGPTVASQVPADAGGGRNNALIAERDFLLRSLNDLEDERAARDIDEADYLTLREDYTVRAAAVLRRLESPDRTVDNETPGTIPAPVSDHGGAPDTRRWRRGATVAAVVVLAGAAIGGAIYAATGSRAPGQTITGQAAGSEAARLLQRADAATAKGDAVTALKDYRQILATQPDQVQALTDEGWLLAQTQQPALLDQGVTLLARAESVDQSYAPAHVYRGIALLSKGDNAGAIPELQYYLAHQPDPQLVAKVQEALTKARQAVSTPPTSAP